MYHIRPADRNNTLGSVGPAFPPYTASGGYGSGQEVAEPELTFRSSHLLLEVTGAVPSPNRGIPVSAVFVSPVLLQRPSQLWSRK